jgi:hypothetical protein
MNAIVKEFIPGNRRIQDKSGADAVIDRKAYFIIPDSRSSGGIKTGAEGVEGV